MTTRTCVVLALLLAPAAAQDKGATPDLQAQVEKLKAEVAARDAEIAKLRKAAAAAKAQPARPKPAVEATRRAAVRVNLAPVAPVAPNRVVQVRAGRVFFERMVEEEKNPLLTGDYKKALDALTGKRTALQKIEDPTEARKVVDEMERILLEARRALWTREKAAAAAKKAPGEGR